MIDSVPDQLVRPVPRGRDRVDVSVNVLLQERRTRSSTSTARASATVSQGLLAMSNLADGVVLFLSENGDVRQALRNEAYSSLPFSSPRLVSDRDLTATVVKEYKAAAKRNEPANVDHAFLRDRFTWKNRQFSPTDADIEPLALWGSHDREGFTSLRRAWGAKARWCGSGRCACA